MASRRILRKCTTSGLASPAGPQLVNSQPSGSSVSSSEESFLPKNSTCVSPHESSTVVPSRSAGGFRRTDVGPSRELGDGKRFYTNSKRIECLLRCSEEIAHDFRVLLTQAVREIFARCHAVKRYVHSVPSLALVHSEWLRVIDDVHAATWNLLRGSTTLGHRLKRLDYLVKERLSFGSHSRYRTQKKSKKSQEAGKSKAKFLLPWHDEFRRACNVLRSRGYKGSLCLKRGLPVYKTIVELRELDVAAAAVTGSHGGLDSTVRCTG